jgi:hypothetical protein
MAQLYFEIMMTFRAFIARYEARYGKHARFNHGPVCWKRVSLGGIDAWECAQVDPNSLGTVVWFAHDDARIIGMEVNHVR